MYIYIFTLDQRGLIRWMTILCFPSKKYQLHLQWQRQLQKKRRKIRTWINNDWRLYRCSAIIIYDSTILYSVSHRLFSLPKQKLNSRVTTHKNALCGCGWHKWCSRMYCADIVRPKTIIFQRFDWTARARCKIGIKFGIFIVFIRQIEFNDWITIGSWFSFHGLFSHSIFGFIWMEEWFDMWCTGQSPTVCSCSWVENDDSSTCATWGCTVH